MDECIKREAVIEAIMSEPPDAHYPQWYVDKIKSIPAADVAPVRHAKWVDNHCTACGMMPMGDEMWKNRDFEPPLFERFMDYCPNCGALMDKEVADETCIYQPYAE